LSLSSPASRPRRGCATSPSGRRSGYHRDTFLKNFHTSDYIRPDEAVKLAALFFAPAIAGVELFTLP